MRILAHEFVSGGGLAGQAVPATLASEGAAMVGALLADLAATGNHEIVTTADARFPVAAPDGVRVVTLSGRAPEELDRLIDDVDAVWWVAPETGGCLAALAERAEHRGKRVLGPDSAAIRAVSDKAALGGYLLRHGVTCPVSRVLGAAADRREWVRSAAELGYPVVVKPSRGAGCQGVGRVDEPGSLTVAVERARAAGSAGPLVIEQFVDGTPASVSLLADGKRAIALTVNGQSVEGTGSLRYLGGTTPLGHPLAGLAGIVAVRALEAFPGLRGYVGVDLVLTDSDAVVIEINPRLTTAYLGVREVVGANVAELAIGACDGILPSGIVPCGQVRFDSAGRLIAGAQVR